MTAFLKPINGEYVGTIQSVRECAINGSVSQRVYLNLAVTLENGTKIGIPVGFDGPFCAGSKLHRTFETVTGFIVQADEPIDLQSLVQAKVLVKVATKQNGKVRGTILSRVC